MNKIFLKTALLTFFPFAVNLGISLVIRAGLGPLEFNGFFNGAMTSFMLSLTWFLMVRISMDGDDYNLLKIMIRGFILKFVFLGLCIAVSFFFFEFDKRYYVLAFSIGTIWTLIVEVWFYLAVNREGKLKRERIS